MPCYVVKLSSRSECVTATTSTSGWPTYWELFGACHEASHAVMAVARGLWFDSVTIALARELRTERTPTYIQVRAIIGETGSSK